MITSSYKVMLSLLIAVSASARVAISMCANRWLRPVAESVAMTADKTDPNCSNFAFSSASVADEGRLPT
jgi:cell division protein FtsL